ncbi:SGNH/GDSL hydrolase family protein [Bacillus sp. CGMCC 1.16607]|uniref:SGNH/GDSL hydrolase family protein n=1 Tax=Bacillus sp. CGMCC 1.16607 TaxID=3351842 RepID=UPI00362EA3B9
MKIALWGDSLTEGRPGVSFSSLLEQRMPENSFTNYGKPGDTLISMYKRMEKEKIDFEYDITFIWIGVNDLYSNVLGVKQHPVVRSHTEFRHFYEKVIETALTWSKKVITVSPALIGERVGNQWNRELKELSNLIKDISSKYTEVTFLDLHQTFANEVRNKNCSDYISIKPMKVLIDVLFMRKRFQVDKAAQKRGLHLTLDGVHLNSKGADIVANLYEKLLKEIV